MRLLRWARIEPPSGSPRPSARGEKILVGEVFLLLFVHKKKILAALRGEEGADFGEEAVEAVVMDPVAGAFEGGDAGGGEVFDAAVGFGV